MSPLDFAVLIGAIVGIAAYGAWLTRGRRTLSHYLKGDQTASWLVIGVSVMATQASAVTFMSTPGQGYQDGLGFVQNYFGLPLAMVVIAAVILPIYRRLGYAEAGTEEYAPALVEKMTIPGHFILMEKAL